MPLSKSPFFASRRKHPAGLEATGVWTAAFVRISPGIALRVTGILRFFEKNRKKCVTNPAPDGQYMQETKLLY
jgi:hypothetical protein